MVSAPRATGLAADAHRAPANAGAHPSTLTAQLVRTVGDAWCRGCDFAQLVDQVLDQVAEHIRRNGIRGPIDARLAHAIADAISDHADHEFAPADAPGQLTIDSILACPACRDARRTAERGWCNVCDGAWPIDDRAVSL